MTREEAQQAWEKMRSEIDGTNWLFVGTINPQMVDIAIEALKREPSEDGTLEIKVEDATKVGRVLISDDEHRGGLYYPDEYEPKGEPMKTTDYCDICKRDMCEICVADNANPYCVPSHYEIKQDEPQKGDLISRAEAIEAIELVDWYHQNSNKDMVHGANDDEHQAWYKAQDIYKALEAVPSADRPRGEWIDENHRPKSWQFKCSECGETAYYPQRNHEKYQSGRLCGYNFCPNCRAEMTDVVIDKEDATQMMPSLGIIFKAMEAKTKGEA